MNGYYDEEDGQAPDQPRGGLALNEYLSRMGSGAYRYQDPSLQSGRPMPRGPGAAQIGRADATLGVRWRCCRRTSARCRIQPCR